MTGNIVLKQENKEQIQELMEKINAVKDEMTWLLSSIRL